MSLRSRLNHSAGRNIGEEMERSEKELDDLSEQLSTTFAGLMQFVPPEPVTALVASIELQRARGDWLNRSHAAVFKFLASSSVPNHTVGLGLKHWGARYSVDLQQAMKSWLPFCSVTIPYFRPIQGLRLPGHHLPRRLC
jgi:hypothetical protein